MQKTKQIPAEILEMYNAKDLETLVSARQSEKNTIKETAKPVAVEKYSIDYVKNLCKEAGIEYLAGYEDRIVKFIISTDDVDRMSDILKQEGIDFSQYEKNPVVMYAHDYEKLPVGATLKIEKSKHKTTAIALIYDDRVDKTGLADTIFLMIKSGALRGASVGFMIKEARFPDENEIEKYEMSSWGLIIEKSTLLEWSICSIPANQNALRVNKNMFNKKHIEILKNYNITSDNILNLIEKSICEDDVLDDENIDNILETSDIDHNLIEDIKCQISDLQERLLDIEKVLTDTVRKNDSESSETNYNDIINDIQNAIEDAKKMYS